MKMFFDTEFTGLQKNTDLISIGCVLDNGDKFYAECTNYDTSKCDNWIKENVINKTILGGDEELKLRILKSLDITWIAGSKSSIKNALIQWLEFVDEPIELVSDVCHYDMVLFIDIFGGAFDLPKIICPCCHDINQDIARYKCISEAEAFDINREDLANEVCKLNFQNTIANKHNALHDAEIIKLIYERIGLGL